MKIGIWFILIIGAMIVFNIFTTLDISTRSIIGEKSDSAKFCAKQTTDVDNCKE